MGMTIAEKILARASKKELVKPGEIVIAKIDRTRIVDLQASKLYQYLKELSLEVWDPGRVVIILEHDAPPNSVASAQTYKDARIFAREYGIPHFYELGRHGICHQLFVEKGFARPGELVAAADSHTCTYGALNVASRGIGPQEMLYVLARGELWFRIPESIKFVLTGKLRPGVMSKDVILAIAGRYGTDVALYKSAEFLGDGVEEMSLSSRMTIANMGVEIGAKFALFEADQKTVDYVRKRTNEPFEPVKADPDAEYEAIYEIVLDDITPHVACPHDVSNSRGINQIEGIPVNQAFLGACTNSRFEDLEIAAQILKGHSINPDVRMIVTPGSQEIYLEALRAGLIETFIEAGCVVTNPSCGACGGGGMGILAPGERCISSSNRNFRGRMGSPEAEVYLASPATVAASAITGKITDPRNYIT